MKEIKTKKAPDAVGPYSQAVKVNGLIFCSGQIAINPKTNQIVSEEIETQTEQVLKNLDEVLKSAGASLSKITRCDIFLTSIKDFAKVNKIYGKFFSNDPKPARQTVEVSNLPKGAKIEISCIAYVK